MRVFSILMVMVMTIVAMAAAIEYDHSVLSRWRSLDKLAHNKKSHVKSIELHWVMFSRALVHQYPKTKPQVDALKPIVHEYKSVDDWSSFADKLQVQLALPRASSKSSSGHNNQATW